jgi:hypothetical protein
MVDLVLLSVESRDSSDDSLVANGMCKHHPIAIHASTLAATYVALFVSLPHCATFFVVLLPRWGGGIAMVPTYGEKNI